MNGPRGGFGRAGTQFLSEEEKRNAPKLSWALVRRIGGYLRPYRWQMALVLLTITASSMLGVLPSILTGRIIDQGLIGQDFTLLMLLIGLSFGVTLLANGIGVLESYINTWVAQHITYDMRNTMFQKLLTLSHRFYTNNNQGDVITRMTSDISGVQSVISGTLTSILSNAITLVVALVAMFQKNWMLALLGVVIVPLFAIPTQRVGKTRWSLTLEAQKSNDRINGILNETLSVSGQQLVKLFTNEEREYENYRQANETMTKLNVRESMAGRWFRMTISTVTTVGPMLIYLAGGYLLIRRDTALTVGDITVMVALLGQMYRPVNALLTIQVDVVRSMALFTRIFAYFDMKPEIENAPDALAPQKLQGRLEFKRVAFAYDPQQPILKDISFTLEQGRSVAIVGPSGAGKSSLVGLIPRLYDVTAGQVLLDGMDVRKLDLRALRQSVGMVTQDTYLFNGAIRDNLLYAKPQATQEEMEEACKKANIHDFIAAQPMGYDTVVGNRGLKLSGGEKQRLSIARVILKDPAILIFDEATSSLDSISEDLIQDAIQPLIQSRTSILIAHRLSTVMAADEILVLQKGEIVERGKHGELVAQNGVYTELYETQFRRALEEAQRGKGDT
ncbi:MAG: ABC transporter ATP-binding protein [Candidatus Limiplasma sp.]|nr:ABC transporter ATP-binding protein [Candidatus Limiplasma sp.]